METKTIKTPGGVEMVLKAWITGEESRRIDAPFKKLKMIVDSTGIGKGEMDAGLATEESIKTAIETIVISVAGKTIKIYDEVSALRKKDYQFVLNEVDSVIKDEDFTPPAAKADAGTI
jgi:hypothetical protein